MLQLVFTGLETTAYISKRSLDSKKLTKYDPTLNKIKGVKPTGPTPLKVWNFLDIWCDLGSVRLSLYPSLTIILLFLKVYLS